MENSLDPDQAQHFVIPDLENCLQRLSAEFSLAGWLWMFVNTLIEDWLVLVVLKEKTTTFCGFSMGSNQYWAGRVYDLCVYYMTGTPKGSTESGFMEKPGIEPATPGLKVNHQMRWTMSINFDL